MMRCCNIRCDMQAKSWFRFPMFAGRFRNEAYSSVAASVKKNVTTEVLFDNVFLIGINRPEKRNCINLATARSLLEAFTQFEQEKALSVAVLYGHGGSFCAGFDLSEVTESTVDTLLRPSHAEARPMGPTAMRFSKPVIAAVQGFAVAGGLELACMCDLRVVEENAVFAALNRQAGVPFMDGGTVRLSKLIGLSRALDLILTGLQISGKVAYDYGLANRLVGIGTGLGQAVHLANSLQNFPRECLLADRRSTYYSAYDATSLDDALAFELKSALPVLKKESIKGARDFLSYKKSLKSEAGNDIG